MIINKKTQTLALAQHKAPLPVTLLFKLILIQLTVV